MSKHPNLRVRVVHGNTLTAAVILNEIPSNVREVFLTGATSKLGRAIALYLCRKKIRVLVSSLSNMPNSQLTFDRLYIYNLKQNNLVLRKMDGIERPVFQMLTLSTERFLKIQKEAPSEFQQFLVQVTKYQAAQSCKVRRIIC